MTGIRFPARAAPPSATPAPARPAAAAQPLPTSTLVTRFDPGRGVFESPRRPPPVSLGEASSLRSEVLGDGRAGCLERAAKLARPADSVLLLRDSNDPVGHALVRHPDGSVTDPNQPSVRYPDLGSYLATHRQYSLGASVPQGALMQVLQQPPGPARDARIAQLGLVGAAQITVADPTVTTTVRTQCRANSAGDAQAFDTFPADTQLEVMGERDGFYLVTGTFPHDLPLPQTGREWVTVTGWVSKSVVPNLSAGTVPTLAADAKLPPLGRQAFDHPPTPTATGTPPGASTPTLTPTVTPTLTPTPGTATPVAGTPGATPGSLAAYQQAAVSKAQAELTKFNGASLTDTQQETYRQGISLDASLDWCGMFTEYAMRQAGFQPKDVLTSTLKAITFFTEPDSGRQMFSLEGTVVGGGKSQWNTGHGIASWPKPIYKYDDLPIQSGDMAIFTAGYNGGSGHIGIVESYDPTTGTLVVIEGNTGNDQIKRKTYDLKDANVRAFFDGFGRAAESDFGPVP